ncbi:putative sodium-coupled neutral amino acid transporter 10 [Echinococcus granulosus]|nr:putative sodium-coupled neutral amino acid transporter 10 [Echinococcus granulosus]
MNNLEKALGSRFVAWTYYAGLMGYIAFYHGLNETLPGDMLASYPEDHRAVHIRLGFLYTVAASLPLLLFPLRTALHSLLFEEAVVEEGPLHADASPTIPNMRFCWLTGGVIFLSVVASQTTDKVEVILTYTGGFAGGASCYLLPALIGARAVGGGSDGRRRQLARKLIIHLLYFLGAMVLLSPALTFLGVDT